MVERIDVGKTVADRARQRGIAPRERVVERERVIVAPENRVVVQPAESTLVTTGSSTSRSCFIDLNGFERCY